MPAAPTERKLVEEQNKAYHQNEHTLRFVMIFLFFSYDLENAVGCGGGPLLGKIDYEPFWQAGRVHPEPCHRVSTASSGLGQAQSAARVARTIPSCQLESPGRSIDLVGCIKWTLLQLRFT